MNKAYLEYHALMKLKLFIDQIISIKGDSRQELVSSSCEENMPECVDMEINKTEMPTVVH